MKIRVLVAAALAFVLVQASTAEATTYISRMVRCWRTPTTWLEITMNEFNGCAGTWMASFWGWF